MSNKKNQSSRIERKLNKQRLDERLKSFFKKDKKRKIKDSDYAKDAMMMDLYVQDRSPEKFPGFDQAGRIRGGLKSGGSTCKLAKRGKGKAYGKNS